MREKLSSFYDGDLDQNDSELLVNELKQDLRLQQQWQRYSLYSAAMRDELSPEISTAFSERVQKLLENEPVQLAPASLPKRSHLRGPVIGFAVAASLLAVAILVQKPLLQDATDAQMLATSNKPTAPTLLTSAKEGVSSSGITTANTTLVSSVPLASSLSPGVQQNDLIVSNSKNENVRARINRLLVEHNEYNPASDMTGIWSYSRFVGYNPAVKSD